MRRCALGFLVAAVFAGGARGDSSLVARAEKLLNDSQSKDDATARFALADEAQALCEKAIAETPKDARPHLVLARALSTTDPNHPEACRPGACQRAVEELRRARVLDNGGADAEQIASDLGIVLSRLGAFDEALVEYDRALKLVESDRRPNGFDEWASRAVLYGNSAETLMAVGRLDDAIARYRQAEAYSSPGDSEWQLAEWGLAVALDRDEQLEKAREAVGHALESDPTMAHLSADGVFFEPAGDKRYYEALGHELAGDREQALVAWRDFLSLQPGSRYARRARAHLEALRRAPADKEPRALVVVGDPMSLRGMRTPGQLLLSVRQHEADLRLCHARALREDPGAHGVLRLAMELMWQGYQTSRPRVIETTSASSALVKCVELAAASWRFSTVEKHELETVIVPILFGER